MAKLAEFDIINKYFGNMASLRAYCRKQDIAFLEKAVRNFQEIIAEQKDAWELERMELEEREKNRQAIVQELIDRGWRVEELLNPIGSPQNNKPKSTNKYVFITQDGRTQYWTGKGRCPKDLKEQLDNGKSLDEFLIK